MHYQLYHFNLCPYCAKVRRAIQTMGAAIELVDTRENPEKREELLTATGRTQVPCLKIINGDQVQWLHESDDIIDYIKQYIA